MVKCRRRKPKSFFKFFQSRAVFFRADDVLLRLSQFPCSAQGSVPRHGVALLFCLRLGGVRPELPYFLEAAKRERALAFARLGPPPRPDSKQDEERSANGGGASWPAPPPPSSPSAALPEKVRLRRHSSRRWCRCCQQVPAAGGAGKRGQRPGEYCVIRVRKNKPIGDNSRFFYIGGGEIHALGRNASNLLASVQSGQSAPFFGFKIIS